MVNLKQRIGDDKTYRIALRWEGATFIPGTDWTLIFGVKEDPETDADEASIFQKATGFGITHDGDDALVKIVPRDTRGDPSALPTPIPATPTGIYHWGIMAQHIVTGERRGRVAEGTFELKQAVVRDDQTSVTIYTEEESHPSDLAHAITSAATLDPIVGTELVPSLDGTTLKKSTWNVVKAFVLSGLQIAWGNITGKPTFGDSATKNVGTTAGTVAAGDDSRFTLPIATASVLGGIKSSASFSVDASGVATVSTDYASASQGALADSALQPGGVVSADVTDATTGSVFNTYAGKLLKLDSAGRVTLNALYTQNLIRPNLTGAIEIADGTGSLWDAVENTSVDWVARKLYAANGTDIAMDWTTATCSGTNTGDQDLSNYLQTPAIIPDTDNRTLALTDAGDYIRFSNVTSTVMTIPTNASVAFPIGTQVYGRMATGAGPITLSNAGVTVNNGAAIAGMRAESTFALIKVGTDEWDLIVGQDGFDTAKTTLVGTDKIALFDSEAADAPKYGLLSAVWTYIKSVIDAGQTWAGLQQFSTRPRSSAALTPANTTELITLADALDLESKQTNILHLPAYVSAVANGGSVDVNGRGHGFATFNPGGAINGHATVYYASNITGEASEMSLANYYCASGAFMVNATANAQNVLRFLLPYDGVPAAADAAAFTKTGIGWEADFNSDGYSRRIRLIYHNGSTYRQSAWHTFGNAVAGQHKCYSWRLESLGNGVLNLSILDSGSYKGPVSLVGAAINLTVADAPTGFTSYLTRSIMLTAVNSSSAFTNQNWFVATPIKLIIK